MWSEISFCSAWYYALPLLFLIVLFVLLLSFTSASAARCAFVRSSQSVLERVNKSVSVSLYIRNKTGIKKIRKRVGVSVLLHLRPHRSMQAHRAIGTDGCVDPIAWLVWCLLRSIRNWLFVKSFPKKIRVEEAKKIKGERHFSLFLPPIWWWWCRAVERDFY